MAYTLSNLLRDSLGRYGDLSYGRATGGTTTTLIDTVRGTEETPETFEQATLIVLRDSAGGAAAPEGEFERVSDFDPSTQTFSFPTALSAAVASGDRYAVSSALFQHEELIELANESILNLNETGVHDTSITTAAQQTEYTLPVALKREDVLAVEIQGRLNDANDNRWFNVPNWSLGFAGPGSTGLLILSHQPPTGYTIRLTYTAQHARLETFGDVISEYIHPVLARASLVEVLASRAVSKTKHSVPADRLSYNKAAQEFEDALEKWPIMHPRRHPKYFSLRGTPYYYTGEPNLVRLGWRR